MQCWFCLQQRPGSAEHLFPLAIGGTLLTDRVCRDCNSVLGRDVDAGVVNHLLVALRRDQLGLQGNSGAIPDGMALLGQGVLAADPGQRVRVSTGPDGRLDVRLLYRAEEEALPDGALVRRITIDARDASELPKMLQRERRRHGLEPLSPEVLAETAAKLSANRQRIDQPQVISRVAVPGTGYERGLLKIIYEVACRALGDAYLADPRAAELRDLILGRAPLDSIDGWAQAGLTVPSPMKPFCGGRDEHVALLVRTGERLIGVVALFGQFYLHAEVAAEASPYVAGDWPGLCLRLNVAEKTLREASLRQEAARLWHRAFKRLLLQHSGLTGPDGARLLGG